MDLITGNHQVALDLARQGLYVFPCHEGGEKVKQPKPGIFWRSASTIDEKQINQWWKKWPNAVPALDLGKCGLIAIDADRHDENDGVNALGDLMAQNGFNPDSAPMVGTPNNGTHYYFKHASGDLGNSSGSLPKGVDVRGARGYVIAPNAKLEDGRSYELFGDMSKCFELPQWLHTIITTSRHEQPTQTANTYLPINDGDKHDEIAEMLSFIDPNCGYQDWLQTLMAIHAALGSSGLDIADQWSAKSTKYKGRKEIEGKWKSFKGGGVNIASLAILAREAGADLSKIAIKYHGDTHEYDPVEASIASRRLIENKKGELSDAETGELVETKIEKLLDAKIPEGLVGDIAKWILNSSRLPQPHLAIGAALTIVGMAAGRQFAGPTMAGTALYVLGLAPTGSGKDHPLKCITRICNAANLSQHLGPPEFISMTAIIKVIVRKPLSICPMDEFGDFMRRVYSRRGSPHERAVPKVLRTLWSANFGPVATPEWANVESVTANAPHMSIFGVSTEMQFYSALEGGAASDGTLNRFLIIGSDQTPSDRDPISDPHIVPKKISERLRAIYLASGEMAATSRNDPFANPAENGTVKVIPWCADGSEALWREFSKETRDIMVKSPDKAEFHVRALEMSIRIATIIAIGCSQNSVRIENVRQGIQMSRESVRIMIEGADDYMAENENQASAQKIVRTIKKHGGMIKYRDLVRALQSSIKARDLKDMVSMMIDGGQIEKIEIIGQNGGRPAVSLKIIK